MKAIYTLQDKLRILKPLMESDEWYTSEKIRAMDPMKKIKFEISGALSNLYKKGYLLRTTQKRIYFTSNLKTAKFRRRYKGQWAYKFKPEFLINNHIQLNLNL